VTPPRLLVLTDRTACSGPLADTVAIAVEHGARAVVLREKDLPPASRADLVDRVQAVLDPVGGLLIVAGSGCSFRKSARLAVRERSHWGKSRRLAVHLAAADPFPSPRPSLVGRSCHTAAELARAGAEGCDYVTLSPVYPTPSKPGYGPALGPAGLASLAASARPLVYALGGITPDRVAECLAAGAHGVAVMGAIMREPSLAAAYLSTMEDQ
jgi:thiamine-phosphate pyrophosphorylase